MKRLVIAITLGLIASLTSAQSLLVSTEAIDFGTRPVGSEVLVVSELKITNTGSENIFDITLNINGNALGEYRMTPFLEILTPGGFMFVNVILDPVHPGRKKRTLSIDGSFIDDDLNLNTVTATVALDAMVTKD